MMILLNSTNTRFEAEGENKSGTCDDDSEMTEGVDFGPPCMDFDVHPKSSYQQFPPENCLQ